MNAEMRKRVEALYGPINIYYVDRIEETIEKSLKQYPRIFALRFDLRFPSDTALFSLCRKDPVLMTRFMKSLASIMEASKKKREKEGARVHDTELRYVWVREVKESAKKHYHVLLLLNKDAYYSTGRFDRKGSLADMISRAWLSAIGLSHTERRGLVHFPSSGGYWLNTKLDADLYNAVYDNLVIRTSYLAKEADKRSGDGERNLGCSQK